MSGRVLAWAGVAVAVVAAVVLAVFWLVQGLEQAGWLAGVLSAFAALAAFVMALPLRPHTSAAATSNTFSGGTNAGPLVMGRDISGPVTSYGAPAPGAAQPPPASPGPAGESAEEPSDEAAGRASRDRPDDASAEA